MWINYKKLDVADFNQITTSIDEFVYFSIKNSYDGVFASSSLHVSVSKMIDKAERKATKIEKYIVKELYKHRTMNHGLGDEYFIDIAYKSIEQNKEILKKQMYYSE